MQTFQDFIYNFQNIELIIEKGNIEQNIMKNLELYCI